MDIISSSGDPLEALTASSLDPLFWRPARLGVVSAWYGHVPFAQWLMAAARPGCLVELGAHAGVSYVAFCDAAQRSGVDTKCYAVDTWRGDEHAGFYDDSIYADLAAFHDRHYSAFSRLMRCTFDEALPFFADGSIDLLHIDGRHRYEDVFHDFESWRAKLSPRAVVLFHDTNERALDFGVWRLWGELRERHEHFEFLHSHGLGVLAYGPQAPEAVLALCRSPDAARLRARFSLLGERWEQDFLGVQHEARAAELNAGLARAAEAMEAAHADAQARIAHERGRVEKQAALFEAEKEILLTRTAGLQYDIENLRNDLSHALSQLSFTQTEFGLARERSGCAGERDCLAYGPDCPRPGRGGLACGRERLVAGATGAVAG